MYIIPEANFARLEAAVTRLAKKAVKLGLTPPIISVVHEQDIDDTRFLFIILSGDAPVINGYKLLAVLEHGDSEVGNIIRVVPGETLPTSYRTKANHCDHCNSIRRRNETFVVSNDAHVLQIGRNCLADFCRSPEAARQLAGYAEYERELDEAAGECERVSSSAIPTRLNVNRLLELTIATIRTYGWMSRREASYGDKTATASVVATFLIPEAYRSKLDKKQIEEIEANVKPEDATEAEGLLAWVRGFRDSADSITDYLYNLLVVLSDTSVAHTHFGVACSSVTAYRKYLGQLEEARAPKAVSTHVGEVKARLRDVAVSVIDTKLIEGKFGVTTLCTFVDDSGNRLKWFGSGEQDLNRGGKYTLTGTVKAHEEFAGKKETLLSRCVLTEA